MRIGWVTPFNNKSAIASFSQAVCDELQRRGFTVEIIRSESGAAELLAPRPTSIIVHASANIEMETIRRNFDICVVNIGDYYDFHGRCLDIMLNAPSIAVMHDSNLIHLVEGFAARQHPVTSFLWSATDSRPTIGARAVSFFSAFAVSAVVHGPHYKDLVVAGCPGTVKEIPLCYPVLPASALESKKSDSFTLLTFGMINKNKQADRVIKAIAASPQLKRLTRYEIVGQIAETERERLARLAYGLDVAPPDFVTGWISDDELSQRLGQADVICCLRYPISEGGSASLITALSSERPVVVADCGSYSRVPRDLVSFVSYGENINDLRTCLENLQQEHGRAVARAQRAAKWAEQTYSASAYVEALSPLLDIALGKAPIWDATRGIGNTIAGLGISDTDPFVGRLNAVCEDLFGENDV